MGSLVSEYNPSLLAALVVFLVFHLLVNLAAFLVYLRRLRVDEEYRRWLEEDRANRLANLIAATISLLVSFKFFKLLYSRYFGYRFFRSRLSSLELLKPINLLSGVSIILVSVPMVILAAVIAYYNNDRQQLYVQSWEVIALTALMIILLVCETQKPKDFFENEVETYSQYGNSKFLTQEMIMRLDASTRSPIYNSRLKKLPSNSQISEFNEDHKILKQEKIK